MAIQLNRMSAAAPSQIRADSLDRWSFLFSCFAFFYLYSNIGFALPKVWGFPLQPSFFYIAIIAFTSTIVAISAPAIDAIRQHSDFILTLLALSFLEGVRTIFSPIAPDVIQIIITNGEYVLVTISFLIILSHCKRLDRVIYVVGVVVAFNAGLNLVEYFLPQLLPATLHTRVSGRAAGFAEDANESAIYICLALPLIAFFAPRLMRYVWYAVALAGVVVTFSREGILLWVVAVFLTEALKQNEKSPFQFTGLISPIVKFGFVALALAYAVSIFGGIEALFPNLDANARSRLTFTADDSDRIYLAQRGIDMFLEAPLFGSGLGSTNTLGNGPLDGPHNMFILILTELGLVGGIWMIAFLRSIARYGAPFGLLVIILFLVSAVFTHNHFDWPAVGMLFALYLVAARATWRSDVIGLDTFDR